MAGRLRGTAVGQPVEIVADERDIHLRFYGMRAVWRLRRGTPQLAPVLRAAGKAGLTLRVGLGRRFAIRLVPRPAPWLRWLIPELRAL